MARINKTYDDLLPLKDAGLVTTSAADQVDSSNKIIDLGAGTVRGDIVVDVSAIETDSGNEICTIGVQISSSSTFASDIYEVASLQIGDAVPLAGDTDMGVGRYIIPFINVIAGGVPKRYLRTYHHIAGTVGTGFNYAAFLARR